MLSLLGDMPRGPQIPRFARNDMNCQYCQVGEGFCQRNTQHLQFRRKPESIFAAPPGLRPRIKYGAGFSPE